MNNDKQRRAELRQILRSKIEEKQISRGTKLHKEAILKSTLKKIGIDKDKLKEDIKNIKKQGGLEISLNNQ